MKKAFIYKEGCIIEISFAINKKKLMFDKQQK